MIIYRFCSTGRCEIASIGLELHRRCPILTLDKNQAFEEEIRARSPFQDFVSGRRVGAYGHRICKWV